jgi:hypothetical protein
MSFDLNIANYRPEDVVALFKLPPVYCDADVVEKEKAIRAQLLSEDMPQRVKADLETFLEAASNMLKKDWVPAPVLRDDLIPAPNIPYIPSKHEEFVRGQINPYEKRTSTKLVNIDTVFRTNYAATQATDFACVLPEAVRNVMSMQLASIEIPNMIYAFSSSNRSNEFTVRLYNITGESDTSITVYIPDGSYMSDAFEIMMNNIFQNQGLRLLYLEIVQSRVILRARNSAEGASAYDPLQTWYSPNFYFEVDFAVEGRPASATAGWNMGFRQSTYKAVATIIDYETADITRNVLKSESSFGSSVDNYLFLEIDDFHNNFQTDSIVSTNANSYMGKNILGRVVLGSGSFTIVQNNLSDGVFKKREYFGPVRIEKIHIRLLNKFGDVVDLTNNDFSFTLQFNTIYS